MTWWQWIIMAVSFGFGATIICAALVERNGDAHLTWPIGVVIGSLFCMPSVAFFVVSLQRIV